MWQRPGTSGFDTHNGARGTSEVSDRSGGALVWPIPNGDQIRFAKAPQWAHGLEGVGGVAVQTSVVRPQAAHL